MPHLRTSPVCACDESPLLAGGSTGMSAHNQWTVNNNKLPTQVTFNVNARYACICVKISQSAHITHVCMGTHIMLCYQHPDVGLFLNDIVYIF